jgi:hypothetical protein
MWIYEEEFSVMNLISIICSDLASYSETVTMYFASIVKYTPMN